MASHRRTATDPDDPFLTAFDRAVLAAGYAGTIQFRIALDNARWWALTAAERADMMVYWEAVTADHQWDAMLLRQMSRTRYAWTGAGWESIPWSEAEKAAERRAFQETL